MIAYTWNLKKLNPKKKKKKRVDWSLQGTGWGIRVMVQTCNEQISHRDLMANIINISNNVIL